MIECANIKSQAYKGLNKRSTDNANWENVVNLDLHQGDAISVANAIINIRGISSDSTVEILGEDNKNGLSDSKMGMRFTPYVNDNGTNTVALPFCCANRRIVWPVEYVIDPDSDELTYPTLQSIANTGGDGISFNMLTTARSNDAKGNAPYNAGEPVTSGDNFQFSYTEGTAPNSPFANSLYTYYTENAATGEWNSISGHKYTIMDPNYMGPFRSDTAGNFHSGEDDCKPMYLDIKVDVNGPLYESPSTIADNINQQLNTTNVYGDNDINPTVLNHKKQTVKLPALTGPLLKVKKVNGTDTAKGDNQKLWGNIACRDINKWMGIHALMRADLAFNYNINFNDATELLKMYQPCFLMPSGAIDNQVYYPRTTKNFEYTIGNLHKSGTTYDDKADITYTTLPQYFLMTTNMKYNEANIKRIQTYMRNTEKYDGVLKENEASDIENWRSHWDIGFSDHSGQDNTKYMYYDAHGNFYLVRFFPQGAYANWTQYANANPYFPYKDKVDVMSTSRSDVPNIGYTQMIVEGDLIPDPVWGEIILEGLYNLTAIKTDVPHFKDNKNKDAAIAFYSQYDSSWQQKVKTDNLDVDNISFADDSLSKQYNVGCYPITIKGSTGPDYHYDLTDTYWRGYMNNLSEPIAYLRYTMVFKIVEGTDDDHKEHGGYSMLRWNGPTTTPQWEPFPDMYIYTSANMKVPTGRDPLTGLVFDGNYPLDDMATEGQNWVIFDYANDQRFAALIWKDDQGDGSRMSMYYCEPGFNFTNPPYFPDDPPYHNFNPLGEFGFEFGGHYYDVQITDMYVMSTNPSDPHYDGEVVGVNNKMPELISNQETVCGFMLYRDSATKNGDSWDISPDFALPGMHQAQFCASASFIDNQALWMVNAQRYDDSTDYPTDSNVNTNYMAVGTVNPTFQWDNALSRCTFTNLHTPKTLGAEDMPEAAGELTTTTIGNQVVKVADNKINYGYIWKWLETYNTTGTGPTQKWLLNGPGDNENYLLNYSIGGISIDSMYGETTTGNSTSMGDMTLLTEDNWYNCLLYKLGFDYENLFPKFGSTTNIYDYSKINSLDPAVRYEKLKPLTTNPLIDISSATDLPVQDATWTEPNPSDEANPYKKIGYGLPTYTLSVGSLTPTNLDGGTSEAIIAANLPIKQSTPYYTIYCNLSSGEYISNTDAYQILGIIQKRFIAGDYVYADPSPPMTVKLNQKVTRIEIQIRDNAGRIVSLNDNNTVILAIQRVAE